MDGRVDWVWKALAVAAGALLLALYVVVWRRGREAEQD